ncbi:MULTISPECIES: conserved phage C-terminal domain-containing protein [Staphylococcus]|uniref:Conserved phage C-terminal domain-containing protein n=2 Tax=Staphylococcus TaxID=1279 RepID=A0AAW7YLH5_9STAP|nr:MULTISPECIES: conserved phage C-terminal domain-containing protein [Staphylococcus]MCF7600838.1 conserved phage C-terminal domain-containing protein [Staphylococcus pasteuri]MDO6573021.1 conserved phage C-terminal domain-containing protein [Staphylococcus pasteuri_A]
MKDTNLDIEAKALYSYLSSYAGSNETAFPSVSLICHELKISEKRFQKYRKQLEDNGYLFVDRERTDNGFSKNIYTINHNSVSSHFVPVQNLPERNLPVENVGTKNNSIKNNSIKNNNNRVDHFTYKEIIEYLNRYTGKKFNFRAKANQELIKARFNEGYSKEDFLKVIDNKVSEWINVDSMKDYLQPSTLFRKSNFDKYLNQTIKQKEDEENFLDKLIKEG